MKYQINPCSACAGHFDKGDFSGLANCCATVAAGFGMNTSVCDACLDRSKIENGRDLCQYKNLGPGVAWVQTPSYFPALLQQGYSKSAAYNKCVELCTANAKDKQECIQTCQICADAVVEEMDVATPKTVNGAFIPQQSSSSISMYVIILVIIVIIVLYLLFGRK